MLSLHMPVSEIPFAYGGRKMKYKRNEQLIAASMNEEIVMMDVISGKYYSLGVTGGAIWEILKKPQDLEEIVGNLLQEFDISREICSRQVSCFLESAAEKGIIETLEE